MSLGAFLKDIDSSDLKVGSMVRIRLPDPAIYSPEMFCDCTLDNCDCKPGLSALMRYDVLHDKCVPITQEWINREAASAARLMAENRELRERITALEVEIESMRCRDNPAIIAQSQWMPMAYPIVKAESEPLPQSESDRIFWDALRMAAQT